MNVCLEDANLFTSCNDLSIYRVISGIDKYCLKSETIILCRT